MPPGKATLLMEIRLERTGFVEAKAVRARARIGGTVRLLGFPGGDMATTRRYLDTSLPTPSVTVVAEMPITPININCLDPLGRSALLIGLYLLVSLAACRSRSCSLSLSRSHRIRKHRNDRAVAQL